MEQILGGHIEDPERRKQFIEDNCDQVEEKGYMKPFAQEEIEDFEKELSVQAISLDNLEQEKKATVDALKQKIDPVKSRFSELLKKIREKAEWTKESCYKYVDHEDRLVRYYNSEGVCVESRSMRSDERQKTIPFTKTGTNN